MWLFQSNLIKVGTFFPPPPLWPVCSSWGKAIPRLEAIMMELWRCTVYWQILHPRSHRAKWQACPHRVGGSNSGGECVRSTNTPQPFLHVSQMALLPFCCCCCCRRFCYFHPMKKPCWDTVCYRTDHLLGCIWPVDCVMIVIVSNIYRHFVDFIWQWKFFKGKHGRSVFRLLIGYGANSLDISFWFQTPTEKHTYVQVNTLFSFSSLQLILCDRLNCKPSSLITFFFFLSLTQYRLN